MENLITKAVRTIIVITLLTGILATIGCGHAATWDARSKSWVSTPNVEPQASCSAPDTTYQVRRFVGTMLQGLSFQPPYSRPSSRDIRELSDETEKLRQELERRRLGY